MTGLPMTGLSWLPELDAAQQAQVLRLLDEATRADGVAPVSEPVLLGLHGPAVGGRPAHLLATDSAGVIGYGHLATDPPMAELAVHPEHRRQGVGRALVGEVLRIGGEQTRIWAHGNGAAAQGLARTLGMVGRRELWQMRLNLATVKLPPVEVPAGVRLRTFVPDADDEAVLAVNRAAFSWHPEQGGWTGRELAQRRTEPWFDPHGFFLAVSDEGQLLGFHWTKVHDPEGGQPALGEVYVVGVAPRAQGRGLGRVLTLAGLHHLREQGLRTVLLYVEADNHAAVHTYRKLGFTAYHVDVAYGCPSAEQ